MLSVPSSGRDPHPVALDYTCIYTQWGQSFDRNRDQAVDFGCLVRRKLIARCVSPARGSIAGHISILCLVHCGVTGRELIEHYHIATTNLPS